MRALALAIFALILVAPAGAVPPPAVVPAPAVAIDGNDFMVGDRRIRLWGIDAPEMRGENGHRARAVLDDLIAGQRVRCEPVDRDRYKRLIARCSTAATPDLGEAMLRAGAAVVYRRFTVGSALAERYDAAEKTAREAGVGVWAKSETISSDRNDSAARIASALERFADDFHSTGLKDVLSVLLTGLVALAAALLGARIGVKGAIHSAKVASRGARQAAIEAVHTEARIRREEREDERNQERRDVIRLLAGEAEVVAREFLIACDFWIEWRKKAKRGLPEAAAAHHIRVPPAAVFERIADRLLLLPTETALAIARMHGSAAVLNTALRRFDGMPADQALLDADAGRITIGLQVICRDAAHALDRLGVSAIPATAPLRHAHGATLQEQLRSLSSPDRT